MYTGGKSVAGTTTAPLFLSNADQMFVYTSYLIAYQTDEVKKEGKYQDRIREESSKSLSRTS